MAKANRNRYWQIDVLRTVAIVMMVIYHIAFTLVFLGKTNMNVTSGLWLIWQKSTFVLFLLLVGVSFTIYQKQKPIKELYKKQVRRFIVIGSCAAIVSITTFIIIPQYTIYFGILHLIATSMLLLPFTRTLFTQIMGIIICLILYVSLSPIKIATNLLLPLGIKSSTFQSIDYTPLIPWLSIILLGACIGHAVPYIFSTTKPPTKWRQITALPGQYSLLIYMLHEPIIYVSIVGM